MMKVDIETLIRERKEIERLYHEVKFACVRAKLLPDDDNEKILEIILDKYYYDVERWVNEFYRVAGYIYMIDRMRTDAVYTSVLRAIRLDYTVKEFLYDMISDWESYRTTFGPYSIIQNNGGLL